MYAVDVVMRFVQIVSQLAAVPPVVNGTADRCTRTALLNRLKLL
jgi:hypothetical protein